MTKMIRLFPTSLSIALSAFIAPSASADCTVDQVYERAFNMAYQGSESNAADRQIDPPTASGSSAALVDSPQQTKFIAAALQQGLVKGGDAGAFTISLAPFAWINAASPPNALDDQPTYDRYSNARRFTGSLTVGGKGDAIDSDGDGKPDDPADAKNLNDSVAIELQYRFFGSRDRRDYAIPAGLREAAQNYTARMANPPAGVLVDAAFDKLGPNAELGESACEALVKQVSHYPGFAEESAKETELAKLVTEREAQIDTSWVWSVAATVVERKAYLGPDKYAVALRGLKGIDTQSYFKFNLELGRVDGFAPGKPNIDTAKLAVEFSRPVLKGVDLGGGQPTFSAALSAEQYRNAPASTPGTVATLGLKWEFPIAKGITIPFSINWANHTALLSDKDEVLGHVGINLDLDSLSKH